jgi:hypothetical protein
MTHAEKLDRMYSELGQKGLWKSNFAPPLYRLLWRMGIRVPPPHFSSFMFLFVFSGLYAVFFALPPVVVMWWLLVPKPIGVLVISTILSGFVAGLCVAAWYRYQARRYRLPLWKGYGD